MKYTVNDLKVANGVDFIRQHPDRFLPFARVDADSLACCLVMDLLVKIGRTAIGVKYHEWICVGSNEDWINSHATEEMRDRFVTVRAFPEAGANSMHAEVLLGAFASDIAVMDSVGMAVMIKGNSPPSSVLQQAKKDCAECAIIVLFRIDQDYSLHVDE